MRATDNGCMLLAHRLCQGANLVGSFLKLKVSAALQQMLTWGT